MKNPHKRRQRKNQLQSKRRHWRRQSQPQKKSQSPASIVLGYLNDARPVWLNKETDAVELYDGTPVTIVWDGKGDARVALTTTGTGVQQVVTSYTISMTVRGRHYGANLMANHPKAQKALKMIQTGGKRYGKTRLTQQGTAYIASPTGVYKIGGVNAAAIAPEPEPVQDYKGDAASAPDELGYIEGFRMWHMIQVPDPDRYKKSDQFQDAILFDRISTDGFEYLEELTDDPFPAMVPALGSYNQSYGAWLPGKNRYECKRRQGHTDKHEDFPRVDCGCGFWAVDTYAGIAQAVAGGWSVAGWGGPSITGKVQGWGVVVETDRGFRAEYIKVKELYLNEIITNPGSCNIARDLAKRYDVPLGILTVEGELDTRLDYGHDPDD